MQAGRQAGLLWWSSGVGVRAWSKLFIGRSIGRSVSYYDVYGSFYYYYYIFDTAMMKRRQAVGRSVSQSLSRYFLYFCMQGFKKNLPWLPTYIVPTYHT